MADLKGSMVVDSGPYHAIVREVGDGTLKWCTFADQNKFNQHFKAAAKSGGSQRLRIIEDGRGRRYEVVAEGITGAKAKAILEGEKARVEKQVAGVAAQVAKALQSKLNSISPQRPQRK